MTQCMISSEQVGHGQQPGVNVAEQHVGIAEGAHGKLKPRRHGIEVGGEPQVKGEWKVLGGSLASVGLVGVPDILEYLSGCLIKETTTDHGLKAAEEFIVGKPQLQDDCDKVLGNGGKQVLSKNCTTTLSQVLQQSDHL